MIKQRIFLAPLFGRLLATSALAAVSSVAVAESFQLEEVLVSAQKREQGLQDVPIALTAFQGDFIEAANAELIDDLARYTPAMTLQSSSQGEPNIYIRGIGSNDFGVGGDISVGVFIDDIYIGRIHGAIMDLADAERVEILKGPQGTLFGRNTIGGAISITTKKPGDELKGRVKVEGGSYNKRRIDAAIEGPVSEDVSMRLSGLVNKRDGWKDNDFDGSEVENEDNSSLKFTTVYRPTESVEVMFKLAYDEVDTTSRGPQSTNPLYAHGGPYDNINSDMGDDSQEARELWDSSLHLSWERGDYRFKSITGFRDTDYSSRKDTTGTGSRDARLYTNIFMEAQQYSQEFRLNFDDGGNFSWFAGTSIFYEDVEQGSLLESTNETIKVIGPQRDPLFTLIEHGFPDGENYYETLDNGGKYYSYAVYGDASWQFAESWELIGGLRYSLDDKEHFLESNGPTPERIIEHVPIVGEYDFEGVVYQRSPRADNDESWDAWTPRMVLRWSESDDNMIYGSVSRGFKSGGFNSFLPNNEFDPEYVWSYELGNKSSWLDNRLQLNMALFYYDYEDLQVSNIEDALVVLRNAGEAKGQGFEFDATWLLAENWQLMVSGNYLETEFKKFDVAIDGRMTDLSGETMPLAPELQFSTTLMHSQSLANGSNIDYHLSYSWSDDYYFEVGNTQDEYQDSVGLLDARIAWTSAGESWVLAVFGQNLTDEDYLAYAGGLAKYDLDAPVTSAALDRTVGASVELRF